jgi:hypothetical protein
VGQSVLREEAEHVDPLVGHAEASEQQAHRQRVGPDDAQSRTRAPADLRPRAKQHLQALARLLPADEDDLLLAASRLSRLGDENAVRDQVVVARKVPGHGIARGLGDRDPVVDAVDEEPPQVFAELEPRELPARVERGDDRTASHCERRHAGRRRHRLMDVDQVELLPLEDAPHPEHGPRAEDDVRERPVRRHDHRPANRNHSGRRLVVAPEPRVEGTRETARRVVADHDPHVEAQTPERIRLELRVLDDSAPERPRIGDDDPDLHPGRTMHCSVPSTPMRPSLVLIVALFVAGCGEDRPTRRAMPSEPPPPSLEQVSGMAARVPAGTRIALRAGPEGRVIATIGGRTEFGSRQTLAVAARKGDWVAVRSPALGNSELGWARTGQLRLVSRPLSLEVDLSERELTVRGPDGAERRIGVAIGARDTPTPSGEFYVTDRLPGADFGAYYGCCILALSGRQPSLPEGWSGGDRLAIHGSPTPTWGHAVSNGCLHAAEADLRYLMRTVPLGTRVVIHP